MDRKLLGALTKPGIDYPGYVNVSLQDGRVVLSVRGDPTKREGVYVCGFTRDKSQPGRCTPGDLNCNNYCNMASHRGPMADRPKACTHFVCGATVQIELTTDEWAKLLGQLREHTDGL